MAHRLVKFVTFTLADIDGSRVSVESGSISSGISTWEPTIPER
jgi:hypothetical protein